MNKGFHWIVRSKNREFNFEAGGVLEYAWLSRYERVVKLLLDMEVL